MVWLLAYMLFYRRQISFIKHANSPLVFRHLELILRNFTVLYQTDEKTILDNCDWAYNNFIGSIGKIHERQ